MAAETEGDRDFDAAYRSVLSLASKGADLIRVARDRDAALAQMRTFVARLGLDLNALPPVIHVAGTKGKGSTSVMCESILRAHGAKTGLFTSPHLCSLRERFRLDGRPISEPLFLHYFWEVWDRLNDAGRRVSDVDGFDDGSEVVTTPTGGTMPPFFRFLTLLALHLFSAEKVDVLILEVGLGGRLDATNVVPRPVVTAVTTLDLDHCAVLGDTLAEIAREKAGIFKPGVPAVTCPQESSAMKVLQEVAKSETTPLAVVSVADLAAHAGGVMPGLGLNGEFQHINAAIAVAVTDEFRRRTMGDDAGGPFTEPEGKPDVETWRARPLAAATKAGLAAASWPGRAQVLPMRSRARRRIVEKGHSAALPTDGAEVPENVTFFIDGAHTSRSMEACAGWFAAASAATAAGGAVRRILLFNCGHEKSPLELMEPLRRVCESGDGAARFDVALFCPFDYSRPSRFSPPTSTEVVEAFFRAARLSASEG
eukprot:CAMPEP_0203831328 /NCGR_PEP_ID=MMETSP0115-20131106/68001_1 /ASSEMBLY_ACC=CAM_ASM_000227 /TAXON_ID=33651 /ORGANISM="Bicosoecid sp, Strain ms1" /LENGTH=481 /DNA_ID=CAMNT_0050740391 /DNA_START=24 /DNA_END=1465 /DNA_ORIENTATION=-